MNANNIRTNDLENMDGKLVSIDSLVNRVKAEDAKNLRITKSFLWIYIVMVLVYSGLMVFNPDQDLTTSDRISGGFYVASMIAFALIFRRGYKDFKSIDYTLPVIDMLRSVAKLYHLRSRKFFVLSIPIILMDVGLTISFYHRMLPMSPIERILLIQVIYIPVMTLSGFIGYLKWRRKQKPLRDNALLIIAELENE